MPAITLGDTYQLTINMQQDVAIEEIITIGQTADLIDTAPGPSATFNLAELNSAVNFNRDIKDVYSIDPRLNLDGFQINCAGKHPRFNSITLDGVSQNDRFGLNTNGYATATGMPFPFASIVAAIAYWPSTGSGVDSGGMARWLNMFSWPTNWAVSAKTAPPDA